VVEDAASFTVKVRKADDPLVCDRPMYSTQMLCPNVTGELLGIADDFEFDPQTASPTPKVQVVIYETCFCGQSIWSVVAVIVITIHPNTRASCRIGFHRFWYWIKRVLNVVCYGAIGNQVRVSSHQLPVFQLLDGTSS
jgi:hypothetical protein